MTGRVFRAPKKAGWVDHVAKREVPVVQACGLVFAAVYIGLNLLADVISILSNPRLRHPK